MDVVAKIGGFGQQKCRIQLFGRLIFVNLHSAVCKIAEEILFGKSTLPAQTFARLHTCLPNLSSAPSRMRDLIRSIFTGARLPIADSKGSCTKCCSTGQASEGTRSHRMK